MKTSLNKVVEILPYFLSNDIVPFIHGSPALGKSQAIKQLADKHQLELIDIRLSQMESVDLLGLPNFKDGKASYIPFDTFPLENTPLPKAKKGWIVLLDEFNSCSEAVQSASYRLVLDRQIGQYKLHDKCKIIACGNLETDNAIVNPLSTALISRFAHFYIEPSLSEWLSWAMANDVNPIITGFLGFKENCFYTFDSDISEPYASPRTWHMLSKVLNKTKPNKLIVSSLVGDSVAMEFMAYYKYQAQLPTIDKILNGEFSVPTDIAMQYAVIGLCVQHIKTNTDKLVGYLQQFPKELHIVALKEIKGRYPELLKNKEISQWLIQIGKKILS